MTNLLPRRAFWLMLSLVAVAGCSGSNSPEPSSSASNARGALPIEAVLAINQADLALVNKAEDQLAAECMSEYGYPLIPYPDNSGEPFIDVNFRYGSLNPASVDSLGYRRPPTESAREYTETVAKIDAEQQQVSADYVSILFGDATHEGCYPRARISLYGERGGLSSISGFAEILDLQVRSSEILYASDEAIEVQARWSQCMKERGYSFAGWFDATLVYPHTSDDNSVATPEEIAQARADSACRELVDLESILFEKESKILNNLIEENAGTIQAYRQSLDEILARAKNLVAG